MATVAALRKSTAPASPQSDWVPLSRAYLYFGPDGSLISAHDWRRYLEELVEAYAEDEMGGSEWYRIGHPDLHRRIDVEALRAVLTISPEVGRFELTPVEIADDDYDVLPLPGGMAHEFLDACSRFRGPAYLTAAVEWHYRLVDCIVSEQVRNLAEAMRSGAARVWARKNDVLAPFERILPDQLSHFTIADAFARRPNGSAALTDTVLGRLHEPLTSLKGPGGEVLHSVYVAPGERRSERETAVKKCEQWVRELAVEHPERRPFTNAKLWKMAQQRFGKIPKRTLQRILMRHQPDSWRRPGAPSKSRREMEAKI